MSNGARKLQDVVVTRTSMTLVTADSAVVHERREPLASLDLFIPDEDVYVILCYGKPNADFDSMVAALKKSLAETLVEYYVFGGKLVRNDSTGELEILCNNRGVEFTEACVDLELRQLDLHKPDELISGGKLTPKKKGCNFAVQVTEFLRCGSIVVACKFNHRVADAYATNMFLVSWSENAQSKSLTYSPSRMILNTGSPPCHGSKIESFYSTLSSLPPPFYRDKHSSTSRVYYVTADQTIALQEAASTEKSKRTKLESFSAFLWQLLTKSASQDNNKNEELITKMGIVIDGRTRLSSTCDSNSFTSYFGNVISAPYVSETLEAISHKPLTWVAERVAEIIKTAANKDHFLDLIDLVEATRPETTFPTIFWPSSTDGPKVVVSSGLRFPIAKIDFGWGIPLLGFYCLPWEVDSGYVMPVPIPAGNGDWIVYMYLPTRQAEFIEKEAPHVFKPFTFDLILR